MSLTHISRPLTQLPFLDASNLSYSFHRIIFRSLSAEASLSLPPLHSSRTPTIEQRTLPDLKRRSRGGQNLSARYDRLERSLRGKVSYGREIQELERSSIVPDSAPFTETVQQATVELNTGLEATTRRIFKGLVVPELPKPPADDECCMSGCAICVYDLYDEALQDYAQSMDQVRAQLTKQGVSKSEWPAYIRGDTQGSLSPITRPSTNAAMSAFEQLELALKTKRQRDAINASIAHGASQTPAAPLNVSKRPLAKGVRLDDVVEGLRWVLFSRR